MTRRPRRFRVLIEARKSRARADAAAQSLGHLSFWAWLEDALHRCLVAQYMECPGRFRGSVVRT